MAALKHLKAVVTGCLPNRLRRSVLARRFIGDIRGQGKVAGGLFKEMGYSGEVVGSTSDPKFLGTYEAELAPIFLEWSSIPFRTIIDVGAAEGYYAVGLALFWPLVNVVAFESAEHGRQLVHRMAKLNGVDSRMEIRGHCDWKQLQQALNAAGPILLIMDVEGAERELLDPDRVPGLRQSYIIVEIHDCFDSGVGRLVESKLQSSHEVMEVWTKPRGIRDFSRPRSFVLRLWLLPYLKQFASELRPGPMRWLCCKPKGARLSIKE